jgi:signal transduction histidine kinase
MNMSPRHRLLLCIAAAIFVLHLVVAATFKPSFGLTMFGDAVPCALVLIAILAVRENFGVQRGVLPLFWKLLAAGFIQLFFSQFYWFYYDWTGRYSTPSPVVGDALFLLAHVFFLFAFILRPHSASAGRNMALRHLDFLLLTLWWLTLYAYFALPWQMVISDLRKYTPANYSLDFIQHLVILGVLAVAWSRNTGLWRSFYAYFMGAFALIAGGNLILSVAIDRGIYFSSEFFDTPFFLSLVLFTGVASFGPSLQPEEDQTPDREIQQSLWTARVAMVAILSLPVIALLGSLEKDLPAGVASFRLFVIFVALLLLGGFVFQKLNLLARELTRLVSLSRASLENLKSAQAQATHAEKLAALGRLAAGAAHEISNPLTAILGYSELLIDLPALSPPDRESAQIIQRQVHRAQSAVNGLRDSLRTPVPVHPTSADKSVDS